MTDEPTPHDSAAPADRAASDIRSAGAGGVETQRRPAPATSDAERHEGPVETHDERVTTPLGADEPGGHEPSSAHGAAVHEGGHVDDHSDVHMAAEHGHEAHMLGPIDVPAWGAALMGVAVAVLMGYLFLLAIT